MNQPHVPLLQRFGKAWVDTLEKYDVGALPAFMIFLVVVTLGMVLNFVAMRTAIGDIPAALVSGLFEVGILAWKWTSNRKRNNDDQDEIVKWATWLSVILAVGMLVINLFRTTIEQSLKAEPIAGVTFNGWQIAAYLTIGLAALTHIVFYLIFDQNDTDKEYARKNKRSQHEIEQRRHKATDLIDNAKADLEIIQKITKDIDELRKLYSALPVKQREIVLENARQALLVQYQASELVKSATAGLSDLNDDGVIGGEDTDELGTFDRPSPKYGHPDGRLNVPIVEDVAEAELPSYHPVSLQPTSSGPNGQKPDPTIRRA